MTAASVHRDLVARGVVIWADGDKVQLRAQPGVLTDRDRENVRAVKAQLLQLLTRPPLGSARRPIGVRAGRMPARCLWDGCDGELTGRSTLYFCSKCETYFEQLPPLEGEWREPSAAQAA